MIKFEASYQSSQTILRSLIVYGTAHAIVDGTCAAINFGAQRINHVVADYFVFLIILYDVLAFGLQPLLGILADHFRLPSKAAVTGCLFVIISAACFHYPFAAACFAGIGNALFHVGGGMIALNLKPGRSSAPGLFVAPGAIGLLAGTLLGKEGYFNLWAVIIVLILCILFIAAAGRPQVYYNTNSKMNFDRFEAIVILLLLSISIRSLVGIILNFPWKFNIYLLWSIAIFTALGKGTGGILSDRFGWTRITVPGLIISAALLAFGSNYPAAALIGVFLFNLSMPVTLAAVSNMFPGRAGFAFGLTTLALLAGAFPVFTPLKTALSGKWIIFIIILTSAYTLYRGLSLYCRNLSAPDMISKMEAVISGEKR